MRLSEKIQSRVATARLDQERILHVKIFNDVEIKKEDVEEMFDLYRKLGCGKNKVVQLIDGRNRFCFSPEARKRAAELGPSYFIASAIISNSLVTKMMVNFFKRLDRPKVPFKIFSSKKNALKWLRAFLKK